MTTTDTNPTTAVLDALTEHRDHLDRKVAATRGELVDLLATDAHEDDILGEAARHVRARARVGVADTAMTYVRSGDPLPALAAYLHAAYLSGPLDEELDLAESTRRRGYLQEIEAITAVITRHG